MQGRVRRKSSICFQRRRKKRVNSDTKIDINITLVGFNSLETFFKVRSSYITFLWYIFIRIQHEIWISCMQPRYSVKKNQIEPRRDSRPSVDNEFAPPAKSNDRDLGFQMSWDSSHESVALAPNGVWDTISRHMYAILPEFSDSK